MKLNNIVMGLAAAGLLIGLAGCETGKNILNPKELEIDAGDSVTVPSGRSVDIRGQVVAKRGELENLYWEVEPVSHPELIVGMPRLTGADCADSIREDTPDYATCTVEAIFPSYPEPVQYRFRLFGVADTGVRGHDDRLVTVDDQAVPGTGIGVSMGPNRYLSLGDEVVIACEGRGGMVPAGEVPTFRFQRTDAFEEFPVEWRVEHRAQAKDVSAPVEQFLPSRLYVRADVAGNEPPVDLSGLRFQCSIEDGNGGRGEDSVSIFLYEPIIASAGPAQSVDGGAVVQLDATGSYFADGREASGLYYFWRQAPTDTNRVSLADANTATPSFVAPDFVGTELMALKFELFVSTRPITANDLEAIPPNARAETYVYVQPEEPEPEPEPDPEE
ncbi:MAG: hypothetical protein ACP5DC_00075 [Halothiobacillaceae bacterium]